MATWLALVVFVSQMAFGQAELFPAQSRLYSYLLRQRANGAIKDYHWGMLPLSRRSVASFLDSLVSEKNETKFSPVDLRIAKDFRREFEYDMRGETNQSTRLIPGFDVSHLFDDTSQKYLYYYVDSTTSVFLDGFASYTYRSGWGDSAGKQFATLGELGFRLRGTLFGHLGYYLQASNGMLLSGSRSLALRDNRLLSNAQFRAGERFFDFTNGYLRYDVGWFSIMLGREQLLWGAGYADRFVFSDNAVPFDYFKIDIQSNSVKYSFLHGSLVGADTNGHTLSSKYIAAHRLEFDLGSRVRIGLSEMVLYSRQPVNFALLNPVAFLTSAELSTEITGKGDNLHNTLIALDAEIYPLKNVRWSGSLLIDDLSFSSLGKSDLAGNTNKFGYQTGLLVNDFFGISNLILFGEYTRIDPFVMSHTTDVNSYTNWNLSLGSTVAPNSDQWMVGANYDISSRLSVSANLKLQRAGENIIDSSGNILFDAGADILHGNGQGKHPNVFLQGKRVNRSIATIELVWQPVWQYSFSLRYGYRADKYPSEGGHVIDEGMWATMKVDY